MRARAVTKEDKADDLKSKRERIIANPLLRNQHLIMEIYFLQDIYLMI